MIWVGLDLHQKYIAACALDDVGGLVAEPRRLPADAASLVSWLSGLGGSVDGGDGGAAVSGVALRPGEHGRECRRGVPSLPAQADPAGAGEDRSD